MKHDCIRVRGSLRTGTVLVVLLLGIACAEAGVFDTITNLFPAERNKRDKERVLSVLAAQGAIIRKPDGSIRVIDQRHLDKIYDSLQSNDALEKTYGFRKDDKDSDRKSGQFWKNFFDGKDYTRGDAPAAMDPFENDSYGLATKMHSQLTTATDDASSSYTVVAGDLKMRGVDVMGKELRIGVAAGADVYIKAMDALTGGTSTKTVQWAEEAAQWAKETGEDPQKAITDYIKGKIMGELGDKLSEGLKKTLGEDGYDNLMEKYESYGSEQEKLKKLMSDMYKTTGDERFKDAEKKLDEFSAEELTQKVIKKLPIPEILKTDEEKEADKKAEEEKKVEEAKEPEKKVEEEKKPEAIAEPEKKLEEEKVAEDANEPKKMAEEEKGTEEAQEPEEKAEEEQKVEEAKEARVDKNEAKAEEAKEPITATKEVGEMEAEAPSDIENEIEKPNAGEITTTSGFVENSKGRTTLTETRAPDGSVISSTETRTDTKGNVISQTTYKGESGEGKTSYPGHDLRNEEPKSTADAEGSDDGEDSKKAGLKGFTTKRGERTDANAESSYGLMAEQQNVEQSSTRGDQASADAKQAVDAAGADAQSTKGRVASSTAAAEKADSLGKAIADGIQQGVETGASALGSSFGSAAAKEVTDKAFGDPDKEKHHGGGKGGGGHGGEGSVSGKSGGGSPAKKSVGGASGGKGTTAPKTTAATGKSAEATPKPPTRQANFCKKCGSEMTYKGVYYADGTDMYFCPGCNSTMHHVNGPCPWETREVPIEKPAVSPNPAPSTPPTASAPSTPPTAPAPVTKASTSSPLENMIEERTCTKCGWSWKGKASLAPKGDCPECGSAVNIHMYPKRLEK